MIPHHAQAISMAQLASSRAASPQVKALASRIEAAQNPEIQQMSALLNSWGAPVPATTENMPGMHHQPGQMPGMMNNAQMQQLSSASGPAFDRMFLQMMIVHHQGAVSMAQTELAPGTNPPRANSPNRSSPLSKAEIGEIQQLLQQS